MTQSGDLRRRLAAHTLLQRLRQTDGICILKTEDARRILRTEMLPAIGFYDPQKHPDARIPVQASAAETAAWIVKCAALHAGMTAALWQNDLLVHIRITQPQTAAEALWETTAGSLTLLHPERGLLDDFGSDSRDEAHLLFDRYCLK